MRVKPHSSSLNILIILGFSMLIVVAVLMVLNKREEGEELVIFTGQTINVGGSSAVSSGLAIPALSQRDRKQYNSDEEFKMWSPSACSATAIASIFSGYGKVARTTDILSIMQNEKAISAANGLFRYDVFAKVAAKYGMRADLSESQNLEAHFNRILEALKQNTPVLVNVRDAQFFPNGHFVVAAKLNPNNTVTIVNPDPASGRPVLQEWDMATMKTYFSRSLRSVIFNPA